MTGDIESQYPYWLNKRLNNQYDVINKGFGSRSEERRVGKECGRTC